MSASGPKGAVVRTYGQEDAEDIEFVIVPADIPHALQEVHQTDLPVRGFVHDVRGPSVLVHELERDRKKLDVLFWRTTTTIGFKLLGFHELGVRPRLVGQQLIVRTTLQYLSAAHDVDAVGVAHGGQAVGDDDGGATGRGLVQGVLYDPFGLAVEGRRGLVEE